MNNIAEYVLCLIVIANLVTFWLKGSLIKKINLVLLFQALISYGTGKLSINPYDMIAVNCVIDLIALDIIKDFWREATIRQKRNRWEVDIIQTSIICMILAHFLAGFNFIQTYDTYYSILNTLSILIGLAGLLGGIMRIVNDINNKRHSAIWVNQSTVDNRKGNAL